MTEEHDGSGAQYSCRPVECVDSEQKSLFTIEMPLRVHDERLLRLMAVRFTRTGGIAVVSDECVAVNHGWTLT